jgi:hypothetical protein
MNVSDIIDHRTAVQFTGLTFSKFQKSRVKAELVKCVLNANLEAACNWSAELVCAGHYGDLWDTILLLLGKYIHLGNPKLPLYLALRFKAFKELYSAAPDELGLRNNPHIRQLFAEVITILCHSRKKHALEQVKLQKLEDFNVNNLASKLKAPNINYAQPIFKTHDPKELYVAVNEFAYHISPDSKNALTACYWLEWLLAYDALCKTKKEKCTAEKRPDIPVSENLKTDAIWIVWDALMQGTKDVRTQKIMQALLELFCIKFTAACKQKRRFLIYFCVALLTEPVDFTQDINSHRTEVDFMVKKIDVIYKNLKKNEVSLEHDLVTQSTKRTNLDKSMEQLDVVTRMNLI